MSGEKLGNQPGPVPDVMGVEPKGRQMLKVSCGRFQASGGGLAGGIDSQSIFGCVQQDYPGAAVNDSACIHGL